MMIRGVMMAKVIIIIIRQLIHTERIVDVMRIGSDGISMWGLETQAKPCKSRKTVGSKEGRKRSCVVITTVVQLMVTVGETQDEG